MSSIIGNKFKISVFGESHGEAIGCVIDGIPAGIEINFDEVYKDMKRRAPGKDKTATPRLEKDIPHVLSGLINNVTTGAPLSMIIENTNTKSSDYSNLLTTPRPSHSDYPAYIKYNGYNDINGGGHFSGRLTAPIVFAGSIAKQILKQKGIVIGAHIKKIGSISDAPLDLTNIDEKILENLSNQTFSIINPCVEEEMRQEIENCRQDADSIGGEIECAAIGIPVGIGGNMFDTVEGKLSSILFGIPAVKGVEFGIGFDFSNKKGSEANDGYTVNNGKIELLSNNNGGILGGITTGAPIVLTVVIKPTPSIGKSQNSVNLTTMENETLIINGRHDPCIVPRAVPVIEAAVAIGLLDLMI